MREGDAKRPEALAKTPANHDVVISAVKFRESDPQALIDAVVRSGVNRYLVVGGAEASKPSRASARSSADGRTGASRISFADYAVALVDELEQPRHVRKRFTVGY